jgi:sterol desaturase/sphingolipid hydroxylase (fatty acid hydroxylase superfamily)
VTRRALSWLLYLVMTLGAASAMIVALDRGYSTFWSVAIIQTVATLAAIALEHALPFRRAWLRSHADVRTDLAHLVITSNVATLVRWALTVGFIALLGNQAGLALWPTAWPLWAQVALILVIQSFFDYWIHRAHHRIPLLWRLHAVHHSAPRVYWLNQARVHPFEAILDGLTLLPLLVLGTPERALLVFTAFAGVHATLQHANIDLRIGILNWILSLSEAHRWHHSRERAEADSNYGGVLIVWDVVFGTYALPADRQPPVDTGIAGYDAYPTDYGGQITSPFRRDLWRSR